MAIKGTKNKKKIVIEGSVVCFRAIGGIFSKFWPARLSGFGNSAHQAYYNQLSDMTHFVCPPVRGLSELVLIYSLCLVELHSGDNVKNAKW